MAYIVIAYIVVTYIVVTYIVMACIAIVIASFLKSRRGSGRGFPESLIYSYAL